MIDAFWESLDLFEKFLWAIAMLFTTMFVIQTLFTFASGGEDSAIGESDAYVEGDSGIGYQLFTVRNLFIFFTIFGWVTIGCYKEGLTSLISSFIGILSGIFAVYLMLWLMRRISTLKQDGTLQLNNAIHKNGTVYIPVPAAGKGLGKIQIIIQGSTRELDAITYEEESIATGSLVTVTGIKDNLLIVKPFNT